MEKDVGWKLYFSDKKRYADIINGIGCGGAQLVKSTDLVDVDGQTLRGKARDLLCRSAFGANFALIGIENQEEIDYAFPLRNMSYDVAEYEKQIARVRKKARKSGEKLSAGEYLYGFRKSDKLEPVITLILYSGKEVWNGPTSLHELLDFTDIPEGLRELTPDYKINVIEIRKLENTEVFQTDVRQVFDFIRCSEDKAALRELVERHAYYHNMEEDAFDVIVMYTHSTELVRAKEYKGKDGKVDMCTAIKEMIADGRTEGIKVGREAGMDEKTRSFVVNMLRRGMEDTDIMALAECEQELIDEVRSTIKK